MAAVFKRWRCPACRKSGETDTGKAILCPNCKTAVVVAEKWTIRWKHNGKQTAKVIGGNKKIAEAALAKIHTNIAEGRANLNCAPKTPWNVAAEKFLAWSKANNKPKGYAMYEGCVRRMAEMFGGMTLDEITPAKVEEWKAVRLSEGKAPGTVNREITTIKRMLSLAEDWDLLDRNPLGKVKKLEEKGREAYLTDAQADRLLAECKTPHLRMAVVIGLHTGLRESDVLSLRWNSEVDMKDRVIRKKIVKRKGIETIAIPMTATLFEELTAYRKSLSVLSPYVIPSPADPRKCMKSDADYGFATACKRAGLVDFTFHGLRHTFASRFAQKTGNLGALQEILGHSDPKMTKRYAHFCEGFKRQMMEQFDGGRTEKM